MKSNLPLSNSNKQIIVIKKKKEGYFYHDSNKEYIEPEGYSFLLKGDEEIRSLTQQMRKTTEPYYEVKEWVTPRIFKTAGYLFPDKFVSKSTKLIEDD